jgi:hypothetical protein
LALLAKRMRRESHTQAQPSLSSLAPNELN